MIKAIRIRGFQSHIDTEAVFSPHLTVITGATDSGKTAILRAIRWIAFGEPGGEAFINDKTGQAIVEIVMDDDTVVRKTRKSNKTEYALMNGDGDYLQRWECAAVPPEVTAVLGLTKQTFGDIETALNFAYQLEAPFLISLPASASAKVLGKIAGTEVVDLAIKDVAKETYAARQEIAQAERAIEKIDAQLGKYAELDTIKHVVDVCAALLVRYDEDVARKGKLERGKCAADTVRQRIKSYEQRLQDFAALDKAAGDLKQAETLEKRSEECKRLRDRHADSSRSMEQKQQILLPLKNIELANQSISVIEEAVNRLATMRRLQETLDKLCAQVAESKAVLDKALNLDAPEKMIPVIIERMEQIQHLKEMNLKIWRLEKYIAERTNVLSIAENCETAYASLRQLEKNQKRLLDLSRLRTLSEYRSAQLEDSLTQDKLATKTLHAKKEELNTLWAELDVCPLCEQPIMKGDGKLGCKNAH